MYTGFLNDVHHAVLLGAAFNCQIFYLHFIQNNQWFAVNKYYTYSSVEVSSELHTWLLPKCLFSFKGQEPQI